MRNFGGWRVVSRELAEIVQFASPRIAIAGAVAAAIVLVPILLRLAVVLPGAAS